MEKKFIYIGILCLALFVVVMFAAVPSILGLAFNTVRFIIAPGHDAYSVAPSNSSYISTVVYNSTGALDFYVANASAFDVLLPYVSTNESLMNASVALEGKGIFEIINGSKIGIFPPSNAVPANALAYSSYNSNQLFENYYLLFGNGGASAANVTLQIVHFRNPAANTIGFASAGIGMLVLLLLGIGLIAYGIFKKRKAPQEGAAAASREDVDALYKNIESKGKKG